MSNTIPEPGNLITLIEIVLPESRDCLYKITDPDLVPDPDLHHFVKDSKTFYDLLLSIDNIFFSMAINMSRYRYRSVRIRPGP